MKVRSYIANPILQPEKKNPWESLATFNGSVIKHQEKYLMVYRALSDKVDIEGKVINLSTIGMAIGTDRHLFSQRKQIIKPELPWEKYGCEDPRITQIGDKYYIFYTAVGGCPANATNIRVAVAITSDFVSFEKHLITPFNAKAMSLFPRQINGKWTTILTVNTDMPPAKIALAAVEKIDDLWSDGFWRGWYGNLEKNEIKIRRMLSDQVEAGAVPVEIEEGWLMVYAHIQNYQSGKPIFGIEAVLLAKENPQVIIGRTNEPLMVPQEDYELEGMVPNVIFPSGALVENGQLFIYYGAADTTCAVVSCQLDELVTVLKKNSKESPKFTRGNNNPIITPISNNPWESKATFNPAAVLLEDKVYIVYRAMSDDNTSRLGLAISNDGLTVEERLSEPIFIPSQPFEIKSRSGVNSGCEDPRITQIDNKLYMCYTAYDGEHPPAIALTSILVNDFLKRNWNWKMPVLISDPKQDNKDGCIFPEMVGEKYIFCHRAGGMGIIIDYLNDLEFDNNQYMDGHVCMVVGHSAWDDLKIGIAAPPIKTAHGWLLLYHGVSNSDKCYRVGAMLLETDNPMRVIGRSRYPLLEPEMVYEKIGEVNNVVFPCGALVKGGKLLIYYGGADKVVGVAMGDAEEIALELSSGGGIRPERD